MPFEIVMPRLGWNTETGRLGEWLKRDGEYVEAGEMLLTVEGEKAAQDVEALESGTLCILPDSPRPGQEVAVGTILAYLLAEGEVLPTKSAAALTTVTSAPDQPVRAVVGAPGAPIASPPPPPISPRARRLARALSIDWTTLQPSGWAGRIAERDVRQAAAAQPAPVHRPTPDRVSPLARRLAEDLGVDLAQVAGQSPGKRIERADVEAVAEANRRAAAPTPASPAAVPMSAVRRATAERMADSAHTAAPVTLTTEVDATALVRLREELKADSAQRPGAVPSYTDLLVKLSAQALLEHPAINARLEGESIVPLAAVHVGIAVDTERGLLVPVVRDVHAKSLRRIAAEAAALVERARAGRLSVDEMRGGTFTITNLGMYGIDAFTPIINLPECAILGVGRIMPKPVVVDVETEQVAVRQMMFLSLTFDHRLVDGGPAARFLQRVTQYIARPSLWLAG